MDKSAQCYKLHSGVGVRHAELGQDAVLHHQYLIKDEFQFPSVVTETSYLPVNNIPQLSSSDLLRNKALIDDSIVWK